MLRREIRDRYNGGRFGLWPPTRSSSAVPIQRNWISRDRLLRWILHRKLLKSTANSVGFVLELTARVELKGWNIQVLAADSGINKASMLQVLTPAVEKMYLEHTPSIRAVRAEPYDHLIKWVWRKMQSVSLRT